MSQLIITTPEELRSIVAEAVKNAVGAAPQQVEEKPEIIDGATLAQRLGICYNTLLNWRKKGKLPFLVIGDNLRYNYPEVVKALTQKIKK